MKNHQNCGFWTKVLIYTLVATINMLYMPLSGLALVAASEDNPRVYVLGFSSDGGNTPVELVAKAESVFVDGLKDQSKIEYISNKAAKKMLKGKKPAAPTVGVKGNQKDFGKAVKYLKKAKKSFKKDKLDRVLKYAKKSVKYFKANADLIEDFDDVKEAYLYLALGLAENDEDAQGALLTVLAFDPDFTLPSEMEDALEEMFDEATDASKKARLTIESDPEDAEIMVNGHVKSSPAKYRKLPAGDYFVRVSQGSMTPFTKVISLSKKQKETMTVVLAGERKNTSGDNSKTLKSLKKQLAKQDFDNSFFEDLAKLGEWLNADYIVMAGFKTSKSKSRLYPLVFKVSNGKMGQVKARSLSHKKAAKANKAALKLYSRTEKAILADFPAVVLAPGFVLGQQQEEAPIVAAAPAPTPEPVPEPEPIPETLNLDVNTSILLSSDDAAKAMEDSEDEESIAPIERTPFYKEWWFWTVIGVVVVGGGVTAGVLLQPDGPNKTSKVTIPNK